MSGDPDRLREIFSEALRQPSAEARTRYLAEVCGPDTALRQQVEVLLAAHAQVGDFLRPPVDDPPDEAQPGTVIGRYKVLQLIGEGGFGRVFMAEQLEPVRRKVALKIIKLGMDTREVIARFEAERQALAMMDHPNIARVFEAGVTGSPLPSDRPSLPVGRGEGGTEAVSGAPQVSEVPREGRSSLVTSSGRPYFVMELVKGDPITGYCDRHSLPTEQRLRLFLQVCHAVQHAHQKGVIHRDLKPTNILVTEHDGEAVPKVIDFGVAKALGQPLTDKTLFTRLEQMIGTPTYMSPEQAGLGSLDLDTRTDLYALGVLLYELLTGTTPVQQETLHKVALDEVRRMIRETEPPKPSTRLHALGAKLPDVAQRRHAEPSTLQKRVRGDLDWITMKCLEKDRRRRYDTADALAQDLERHLKHEPIVARPPSTVYRARKFIRRHRVAVGMTAAVSASLLVGLIMALVGFTRASRERDRAQWAQRQAADAEAAARAVSDFLQKDILAQADPWVNSTNLDVRKRALVDLAAATVGDRFKNQPRVEAEIRITLSRLYRSLGDPEEAQTNAQRALAIRRREFGAEHPATLAAMEELASTYYSQGQFDRLEALESRVLEGRRRVFGDRHPDTLRARFFLAVARDRNQHSAESIQTMEELVRVNRETLGAEHRVTLSSVYFLGSLYSATGRPAEAVETLEDALATGRRALGVANPNIVSATETLGKAYVALGRDEEAVNLLQEAVEAYDRARPGDWDVHNLTMEIARTYQRLDRCDEMFAFLEKHLQTIPKSAGVRHYSTMCLAGLYQEAGYWTNAFQHFRTMGAAYDWPVDGWSDAALVALAAGDRSSFREAGRGLMSCFDQLSSKPVTRIVHTHEDEFIAAWGVAAQCLLPVLLRPEWLPEVQEQALSLADTAAEAAPNREFSRMAKAIAEYRRGHWHEALQWLEKAEHSLRNWCDAAAACACLRAMTRHQLGDRAAALATLDEVNRHLASMLHAGGVTGVLGLVARSEAERLILGRETSPPVTAESLAAARKEWFPVRALLQRGEASGRAGKWSAARDAYAQALRSPAFDWNAAEHWEEGETVPAYVAIEAAVSLLLAGDRAAYEELCRSLLVYAGRVSEAHPRLQGLRATACLLRPQALPGELGDRLQAMLPMPDAAREEAEARWAFLAQALAALRRDAFGPAIGACRSAESGDTQDAIRCAAMACRAMATSQLGQNEEAARILAQAEGLLSRLRDDAESAWWQLGACQLTISEAHRLVTGGSEPGP
jgi:serine/threonine protein kinase